MVKSAVRGLDATVEFVQQQWKTKLKTFTVTGASKRGWTTWLTGAVDARATAIAPMVIDMLNMSPQMKHQVAAWGDFSREIHDYTDLGLQKYLDTPRGKALHAIVDPYAYRAFLKQPKLILLGTNDRYWPLDALNLYWNELSGEKYILYIPNNGHGLKDIVRISGSLGALHDRAAGKLTLPKLSWKLTEAAGELSMRVESDVAPKSVVAWVAHSATRDFRDSHWSSHPTKANKSGHEFAIAIPKGRFSALYGEAVYNGRTLPYYLSTNVRIVGSKPEPAGGK
jgi:PhoPQ-activated pathogenicity-related protein